MNMEQLREFVSLENRKRDLDAALKAANQKLDELENLIIPQFIEAGVPSIAVTVDGSTRTLSIYPDVYASPLNDRTEVAAALKASELGQYVAENYNSNSLTAYVREVWREVLLLAKQQNRLATEDRRSRRPAQAPGRGSQNLPGPQTQQQKESLKGEAMSTELAKASGGAQGAHARERRSGSDPRGLRHQRRQRGHHGI